MRSRPLVFAVFLFLGLCPAAAEQKGVFVAPEVLNIAQAPFQLFPVTERATASAESLIMVEFKISNTGKVPLRRIGLQATFFTADGNPRGYVSFEMPIRLSPGGTTYAVHGIANFKADPNDRITLVPLFAQAPAYLWRASEEQVKALDRSLVEARGDASQAEADDALGRLAAKAMTPQNQPPPGDPGTGGGCTDCQNAASFCKSFCSPCYPGGLSCSCQPFNISCTCGACPPQTK